MHAGVLEWERVSVGGGDDAHLTWAWQFKINNGILGANPDTEGTTFTSNFPGASFSISSNGTQNGIAWAVRSDQFNSNGAGRALRL